MAETLTFSATLVVMECCACSMTFGMPKDFDRRNRQDGGTFYCPSGHAQSYTETETARLKKKLAREQQHRDSLSAQLTASEDQRRAAERSAAAHKGQATRLRKRVTAGVCPAPECHRHFENLERHIASKHPGMAGDRG